MARCTNALDLESLEIFVEHQIMFILKCKGKATPQRPKPICKCLSGVQSELWAPGVAAGLGVEIFLSDCSRCPRISRRPLLTLLEKGCSGYFGIWLALLGQLGSSLWASKSWSSSHLSLLFKALGALLGVLLGLLWNFSVSRGLSSVSHFHTYHTCRDICCMKSQKPSTAIRYWKADASMCPVLKKKMTRHFPNHPKCGLPNVTSCWLIISFKRPIVHILRQLSWRPSCKTEMQFVGKIPSTRTI